jgi:hypothetical protein
MMLAVKLLSDLDTWMLSYFQSDDLISAVRLQPNVRGHDFFQ